jgi:phosphatidylglycerophosphate synthase
MLHYTFFHVDFFEAGMFVLWISMVVSVWSGVDYYVKIIRAMKPKAARPGGRRAAI